MLKHKSNEILILGAGPAGMACSMELFKQTIPFILVEKEKQVGGLSKTYKFGKYRSDNGPHRFFSKNKYLYNFIENILGEDWLLVNRQTRQYIDGKYYDYPINALQAFKNIGITKSLKMLSDYIRAVLEYRVFGKKIKNFEDYIVANFGRTLGEFNMLNYTEKLWGISCSKLHLEWAEQRIKGLNFREAFFNAIKKSFSLKNSEESPKSLIDQFYYPSLGTGQIYENIKKIIERKNQVMIGTYPIKISHSSKTISKIELNTGFVINTKYLVSSIPVGVLLDLMSPTPPDYVMDAARKLKYRSQVYLFITINKPFVTRDQWIYFPEKEIPIGRISEMKNFSIKMSPQHKTSLFIEYFCWKNDEIWKMTKNELFKMTIDWLEKLKIISLKDVLKCYHMKSEFVYPVYDLNYKRNLITIKKYLDNFSNLIYIGRPGRFKYTNQDHSLEMGILAARSIIERKKINVEDVGMEKEYFEGGYLKYNT